MMNYKMLDSVDTTYLSKILLDEDGLLVPVEAKKLNEVPEDHLMQWCVENAIYTLPTIELIEWLRDKIAGRFAIEIGAGKSGIGRALGIHATDSFMQTEPAMMAYYKLLRQPIVSPPSYVEKLDAEQAVRKYKPQVVIGCYITQRHHDGDEDGNMFGPEELNILAQASYIHVGNRRIHGKKRLLSYPHEEHQFSWLKCRALEPNQNVIYVWNRG